MRVNMDSSIAFDPRFKIAAEMLGVSRCEVIGGCFLLWLHCYQSRSKCLSIPEANASAEIKQMAQTLIAVGLADAQGENHVILHGVEERIKFLTAQSRKGRKGGKAPKNKAKTNGSKCLANAKANALAEKDLAKAYTPSPSPAPSPAPTPSQSINPDEPTATTQKRFVQPTVDEVAAYCRERQNVVDAQKFVDFYQSKGWKVGSEPMKDWKACVRTWERNGRDDSSKPSAARSTAERMQRFADEEGAAQ